MKKNKFLRLASVMLMLCLITTCAISGTFAKYTTNGTATDSARVAKWGVSVTGNFVTADTFAQEYDSDETGVGAYTELTVDASENVFAPGTSGTLADIEITGNPEVAVRITYSADLTFSNWQVSASDYCPIAITVGTVTYRMGDPANDNATLKNYSTLSAFEAAVEAAIAATSADVIAIGSDLDENQDLQVTWSWAFDNTTNPYIDNAKDTALANIAEPNEPTLSISVTATVTQID